MIREDLYIKNVKDLHRYRDIVENKNAFAYKLFDFIQFSLTLKSSLELIEKNIKHPLSTIYLLKQSILYKFNIAQQVYLTACILEDFKSKHLNLEVLYDSSIESKAMIFFDAFCQEYTSLYLDAIKNNDINSDLFQRDMPRYVELRLNKKRELTSNETETSKADTEKNLNLYYKITKGIEVKDGNARLKLLNLVSEETKDSELSKIFLGGKLKHKIKWTGTIGAFKEFIKLISKEASFPSPNYELALSLFQNKDSDFKLEQIRNNRVSAKDKESIKKVFKALIHTTNR